MQYPLLGDFPRDSVVAFGRSERLSAARFLADVERLAAQLPPQRYVLNDCFDRYRFLVGFGAAMRRGQINLLPGNRVPHVWQQLAQDYPDVYCLTDQHDAPAAMPTVTFPPLEPSAPAVDTVPTFPDSQVAAIAFTSGSTGRPKPFPKYWGAVVREAHAGGNRLGFRPGARGAIVATVPPQHMYGFVTSVMIPLQFGYASCRERPFYPEDVRFALEASPVPLPVLVITPTQLRACVLDKSALPPVSFILSSAAPLPQATAEEAEALFGARVFEYYGSTETGAIASRRQQEGDSWHTFDGVRVRPHADGFLVEADYFTESVVLNDVVEILDPSRFRLIGRNSDLVKIGGKRTSLLYLNQQLQEIDGVADGAFVLEESSDGREPRLAAFVVAPGRTREQLLTALRERVDEVFLPRRLWLVPALPRNAAGKLPREQLTALLAQHLKSETAK
ncbi:MAG TPA: AMP-binding protein [Burkholderiales bacterium]|nr:AMP-binding protein [Burkholderiales bacterium]